MWALLAYFYLHNLYNPVVNFTNHNDLPFCSPSYAKTLCDLTIMYPSNMISFCSLPYSLFSSHRDLHSGSWPHEDISHLSRPEAYYSLGPWSPLSPYLIVGPVSSWTSSLNSNITHPVESLLFTTLSKVHFLSISII